ncbi:MAG TPA: hypothetical protein VHW44_14815 [Pseudonocardiaceae bacterium]|jgi:oxalate decarboxylase/phosphoglucose isomerase-like protein (cupin superfamily)|nr:hypothetical protein [Pseudonocardiaceae bacterium]
MTSTIASRAYGQVNDLVGEGVHWPYLFVQHAIRPYHLSQFRWHARDHRSFVVIQGQAELGVVGEFGDISTTRYDYLQGWHVRPGTVYQLSNATDRPLVIVEAGTATGESRESAQAIALTELATTFECPPVSYYTVHKPWGHEVWYAQNLDGAEYAMKQIHMTKGHQSSLQSHERKAETNYVIEGEATVLNGTVAPANPDAVIDQDQLPASTHQPRTGWTSAPHILHRVIARSDYTSIEVSTPELDDVIRWQDDSGRRNGRIETEHSAGHE